MIVEDVMLTRTKIICTMGPAVATYEKIVELIDAGMNVARLNFSHGTHEDHLRTIEMLKKARIEKNTPLAIMLDTKGPEIRIGHVRPEGIELRAGQKFKLVKHHVEESDEMVQMTPSQVFDSIKIGTVILIDDGYIITKVVEIDSEGITVEVKNGAILKKNKGINIPNAEINLPAMTKQDVDDITFACHHGIDIVAASFIRSEDHIIEIKRLLISKGRADMLVIAKIENPQGVYNFDTIMQIADGIMVARGDLGVELPLQEVPALQKMMIKKCLLQSKPVVTATQMLESMIKNPRPTRAEVSDVANAIYDGSSAVMLSGETSVGLYPIETVKMMKSIIEEAEKNLDYEQFLVTDKNKFPSDVSSAVSVASVKTAYNCQARAIFVYTHSGCTARILSKCHPRMPILALSSSFRVFNQMSLLWGVVPVYPENFQTEKEAFHKLSCFSLSKGLVSYGDLVVITSGSAFGISGSTNTMRIESIGDVLVRGRPGFGERIHGQIALLTRIENVTIDHVKDKIVVLSRCTDVYMDVLKHVVGIILQSHVNDGRSEKSALEIAKSLGIPIITRAQGALSQLKEGLLVTMDPDKGIIYNGTLSAEEEKKFLKN